jgi:hypothetical protein
VARPAALVDRPRRHVKGIDTGIMKEPTLTLWLQERPDWHVEVRTSGTLTADASQLRLVTDCDVFDRGTRIYSRSWDHRIPRGLV